MGCELWCTLTSFILFFPCIAGNLSQVLSGSWVQDQRSQWFFSFLFALFIYFIFVSATPRVDGECSVAEVHAPLKPPCRHSSKRNYPHLSLLTLLRVHE